MNPESVTLVISRFQEDLEWITKVPRHFKVVIYNKGSLIESLSALQRADVIEDRDNYGRESETMIHHMMSHREESNEWTVFCQGNPFDHSPDFLELLEKQGSWDDIQPLTWEWKSALGVPPQYLLDTETDGFLANLRIRPELFSLHLWTASRFEDRGSLLHREGYARIHDLPAGTNMAEHFLNLAGLPEIAARARAADCGKFSYGAIFAIRSRLLRSLSHEALGRMLALSRGPSVHGYVFERLWLHIFGEPFLSLSSHGSTIVPAGEPARISSASIPPPHVD